MSDPKEKVCEICQVKIVGALGGDRINFAFGPAGTRTILWQRVCQYVQRPSCINTSPSTDSLLNDSPHLPKSV